MQEEAEEAARLHAAADADDEARAGDAGEEGETRRFWVRSADFAAVAVYVRPLVGERPPHHLLPVQQFLETAGRVYTAGEQPAAPCSCIVLWTCGTLCAMVLLELLSQKRMTADTIRSQKSTSSKRAM